LCSERDDKRQLGTGWGENRIREVFGENRKIGRDSREGDRALVGLANRRLQPLGVYASVRVTGLAIWP
jgi:hypothetical protein